MEQIIKSALLFVFSCIFSTLLAQENAEMNIQKTIPACVKVKPKAGYCLLKGQLMVKHHLLKKEFYALKSSLKTFQELWGEGENNIELNLQKHVFKHLKQPFQQEQAYVLSIKPNSITIKAQTSQGFFYAFQTLNQWAEKGKLACVEIEDYPQFHYRGLMIDCSRHFWNIAFLQKQIDAMAALKLNQLHLHLVDGGGWRMEIKAYPRLLSHGCYRTHSSWDAWIEAGRQFVESNEPIKYGGYYTQKQLKKLVKYARERFITIIPEIEMPGHSNEVLAAYPQLSCTGKAEGFDLCTSNPNTLVFMKRVLKEVMQVFPSKYIHIGGDEATQKYWKTCTKCLALLSKYNQKDTMFLQHRFITQIEKFVESKGRSIIGWDEVADNAHLSQNSVIMSWRGEEGALKASGVKNGVIMTPSKWCYLDHYQDNPSKEPLAIGGYTPLKKLYSYSVVPNVLKNTPQEKFIWGIQANLWTEYIESPSHAEYMMYPRVFALSENAWGTKQTYELFKYRVIKLSKVWKNKGYNLFDITTEVGKNEQLKP